MIAEEVLLKEGFAVCKWRPYVAGDVLPESHVSHNLRRCLNCLYPIKPGETVIIKGKTVHLTHRRDPYSDTIIEELRNFFGDRLSNFKKYTDTLGIFGEADKVVYTPDLVAKKDKEIYIIEVKTNSGDIYSTKEKLEGLLLARKFSFVPLLINLKIDIEATDFVMQEL